MRAVVIEIGELAVLVTLGNARGREQSFVAGFNAAIAARNPAVDIIAYLFQPEPPQMEQTSVSTLVACIIPLFDFAPAKVLPASGKPCSPVKNLWRSGTDCGELRKYCALTSPSTPPRPKLGIRRGFSQLTFRKKQS